MSKILFTWELGSNFGHLSKLVPLARLLHQHNHELLFAVKEPEVAFQMLKPEQFRYIPTPRRTFPRKSKTQSACFTDILLDHGFDQYDILTGLIYAWQNIFELYQPDVIVAQYAPISIIAAHLSGIPTLQLETGFEYPPSYAPYPCFRPWVKRSKEALLKNEQHVLGNINKICVQQDHEPFSTLQQSIRADVSLLTTLPELDHYPNRKHGRYIGPLFELDEGIKLFWPDTSDQKILIYLRPFPALELVLKVLKDSGTGVIAVIPGISEELQHTYHNNHMQIHQERIQLKNLLPQAHLAITHAGHGMASACMLTGIPLLSIPTTIEQWMTSCNLERIGAGIGIRQEKIVSEFKAALDKMLSEKTYKSKASKIAKKYAAYDQEAVFKRLLNTLERMMQNTKQPRH